MCPLSRVHLTKISSPLVHGTTVTQDQSTIIFSVPSSTQSQFTLDTLHLMWYDFYFSLFYSLVSCTFSLSDQRPLPSCVHSTLLKLFFPLLVDIQLELEESSWKCRRFSQAKKRARAFQHVLSLSLSSGVIYTCTQWFLLICFLLLFLLSLGRLVSLYTVRCHCKRQQSVTLVFRIKWYNGAKDQFIVHLRGNRERSNERVSVQLTTFTLSHAGDLISLTSTSNCSINQFNC